MPQDAESANETDSLLGRGQREVKRFWEGFIDFAFQGNILQIAFGLMSVLAHRVPFREASQLTSTAR